MGDFKKKILNKKKIFLKIMSIKINVRKEKENNC